MGNCVAHVSSANFDVGIIVKVPSGCARCLLIRFNRDNRSSRAHHLGEERAEESRTRIQVNHALTLFQTGSLQNRLREKLRRYPVHLPKTSARHAKLVLEYGLADACPHAFAHEFTRRFATRIWPRLTIDRNERIAGVWQRNLKFAVRRPVPGENSQLLERFDRDRQVLQRNHVMGSIRAHTCAAPRVNRQLDARAPVQSAALRITRRGLDINLGPYETPKPAQLVLNDRALPPAGPLQRHVAQFQSAHGRTGRPGVCNSIRRWHLNTNHVTKPESALGPAPRNLHLHLLAGDRPADEYDSTVGAGDTKTSVRGAVHN